MMKKFAKLLGCFAFASLAFSGCVVDGYECYESQDCWNYPNDICVMNVCYPRCSTSADCNYPDYYCGPSQICEVNPYYTTCSLTGSACYYNSDCCNASDKCYGGACVPRCATSADCNYPQYYCSGNSVCEVNPYYTTCSDRGGSCYYGSDCCYESDYCDSTLGQCATKSLDRTMECRDDYSCLAGQRCYDAACFYICESDANCIVDGQQGVCSSNRVCFF